MIINMNLVNVILYKTFAKKMAFDGPKTLNFSILKSGRNDSIIFGIVLVIIGDVGLKNSDILPMEIPLSFSFFDFSNNKTIK